jgi:ATP-dependent exoDNAse (exonuclease V) alpha subunit
MTHNNYDIGVMNGEEGKVHEITDEGLKILFKDTLHTFKFVQSGETPEDKDDDIEDAKKNKDEVEELKSCDLIHSFAVSVHKSQGSEAKYVILFLPEDRNFTNFLNINLIYTAITRTKKTIWIVSSKSLLGKISQTSLPYKNDGLGERLRNMKNVEKEKILETFVLSPSFETSLNSSVGLTAVPDYVDIDNDNNLYDDLWD